VWSKTGMVLTDLGPNELDWIEFGSVSWEKINLQAAILSNELLSLRADMNFMVVPEQNNLTADQTK
jgi:hypothetical protein